MIPNRREHIGSDFYNMQLRHRAAGGMSPGVGGGTTAVIKSIQRGNTLWASSRTANQTITAVNMAKSFVNITGWRTSLGSTIYLPYATLTSSTNILFERDSTGTATTWVGWEVIEYE